MLIIEMEGLKFEVELYDNGAVTALVAALPQTISMSRWGDEYYGRFATLIPAKGEKRDSFDIGEVALWPPGNAFCIFFGPTPASTGSQPKMASPGVPLGKITTDPIALNKLGSSLSNVLLKLRD